jgi:hypothetical protein
MRQILHCGMHSHGSKPEKQKNKVAHTCLLCLQTSIISLELCLFKLSRTSTCAELILKHRYEKIFLIFQICKMYIRNVNRRRFLIRWRNYFCKFGFSTVLHITKQIYSCPSGKVSSLRR